MVLRLQCDLKHMEGLLQVSVISLAHAPETGSDSPGLGRVPKTNILNDFRLGFCYSGQR